MRTLVSTGSRSTAFKGIFSGRFFTGDFFRGDFIQLPTKSCVSYCKSRKSVPRPVVSLPMASQFNETISMDLKSYNNVYFSVLVGLATRYYAAILIGNKLLSTVIKGIFEMDFHFWIAKDSE